MRLFLLALSLTLGLAAAPPPRPANLNELKQKIYQIVHNSPAAHSGQVGVYVQVLKTGRIVYSENALKPMIPASNLKVVTTAAALDLLGPDYRYLTELRGSNPDAQGNLRGNLYLRGTGDPSMVLPYVQPSAPWKFFGKHLRDKGVSSIEGDLIGDDSAFDRQYLAQGWLDRYLLDTYAAPISALSCNSNAVEMTITSQGVQLEPPSLGFPLSKDYQDLGYEECWVTRDRSSETTVVKGSVPAGSVIKRSITVANPGLFTLGAFSASLRQQGIAVRGRTRLITLGGEVARCRATPVIAQYKSPRLKELVAQVNKESDNVFAGHLFKTLGERTRGLGSAPNAEAAVKDFFRRNSIQSEGLVMVDGSGLSTHNRITPRQLVGVLEIMWRHGHGQAYVDSLPTGGEGTLTSRLSGLVLRAKTGTLDEHSALTGYLVSAYGQTLGFSILVNDVPSTWSGVELEDKILHTLAAWDKPF